MEEVKRLFKKALAYYEAGAAALGNTGKSRYLKQRYLVYTCVIYTRCIRMISNLLHNAPEDKNNLQWYLVTSYYNRSHARRSLGELAEKQGDEPKAVLYFLLAVEDCSEAIKLDSNPADTYNNRGLARRSLGELTKKQGDEPKAVLYFLLAVEDCSEAIKLNPDEAIAYHNCGDARVSLGELTEKQGDEAKAEAYFLLAVENFSEATKLNSNHADAYYNRGIARSRLGELVEKQGYEAKAEAHFLLAVEDYSEAIKLDFNHADAYNNRGNARRSLGELTIRKRIEALNEVRPDPVAVRQHLLDALLCFEQAALDFDLAMHQQRHYSLGYFNRGLNYKVWGDALQEGTFSETIHGPYYYRAALANWMRFVALAPDRKILSKVEVIVTFLQKHFERAVPYWAQRLAERFPLLPFTTGFPQLFHTANALSQPFRAYQQYLAGLLRVQEQPVRYIRWQLLVTFYMGNPVEAYRLADEATDDSAMNDYQVFYYYVKAALDNLAAEPALGVDPEDMLTLARNKAEAALHESEEPLAQGRPYADPEKIYYAGQLFALREKWEEAHRCFELAGELLPAVYMRVLSLGKLGNAQEQAALIARLLKREQTGSGKGAYLFGFPPRTINPNDPDFLGPIQAFAHYQEVQEALLMVRQAYEAQLTSDHVKEAFHATVVHWKPFLHEVWRLSDDYYRALLDRLREAEQAEVRERILQEELLESVEEYLLKNPGSQEKLKAIFASPFTLEQLQVQLKNVDTDGFDAGRDLRYLEEEEIKYGLEELEKGLGRLIKDKDKVYAVKTKFLLIRYFVIKGTLELYPAVCLLSYLSCKEFLRKHQVEKAPSPIAKAIMGDLLREGGHETVKKTIEEYLPETLGDFIGSFQLINALKNPHTTNIANAAATAVLAMGIKMLIKFSREKFFAQQFVHALPEEPLLANLDHPDTLISDYERFKALFVQLATHQLQQHPTEKKEVLTYLEPFFAQWTGHFLGKLLTE